VRSAAVWGKEGSHGGRFTLEISNLVIQNWIVSTSCILPDLVARHHTDLVYLRGIFVYVSGKLLITGASHHMFFPIKSSAIF
jgi:hypothetical protein